GTLRGQRPRNGRLARWSRRSEWSSPSPFWVANRPVRRIGGIILAPPRLCGEPADQGDSRPSEKRKLLMPTWKPVAFGTTGTFALNGALLRERTMPTYGMPWATTFPVLSTASAFT